MCRAAGVVRPPAGGEDGTAQGFLPGEEARFFCGRPGSRPGASGRLFPTPVGTGLRTAIMVGECKWWTKPLGANVLSELQQKARAVLPHFQRPPQVYYALFARNGFTGELHQMAAERHDLLLIEAGQFHGAGDL